MKKLLTLALILSLSGCVTYDYPENLVQHYRKPFKLVYRIAHLLNSFDVVDIHVHPALIVPW